MKRLLTLALLGALASTAGSACAESVASVDQAHPKVLPVLVQVNAHGKITEVSPATRLTPALDRLLRQNLAELISRPAMVHGQPVPSQFVINLSLNTAPREGGGYQAQFQYVSTSPVPAGSWFWVNMDGRRLALADRHQLDQKRLFDRDRRHDGNPSLPNVPGQNNSPPGTAPSAATASFRAAPAVPRPNHGR